MKISRPLSSLSSLSTLALVALAFVGVGSSLHGQSAPGNGRVPRILPVEPPFLGQINITAKLGTVSRSGGQKSKIIVTRNGGISNNITINLAITGTAVNGEDYAPVSTTVVLPVGVNSAKFKIVPLTAGQPGKIKVVVVPGDGYSVSAANKVKVKIVD